MSKEPTVTQIMKKAAVLPDEISFECAETGEPLEDFGVHKFTNHEKFRLAEIMLRQHQSLETIIMRAIKAACKKAEKEYGKES